MTERSCPRAWQAEAVLDGVLSQADSASFERHAATCAECSAERDALARLERVAQRTPSFDSTALRRRALHHELLRRANELSVGEVRQQPPRRTLLWFAFAVGALGLALFAFVERARLPFGGSAEPTFELAASPRGVWRYAERGPTLRLALEAGTHTISVAKLGEGQRFLVNLPDGELEVRGTRFVVELEGRRTRRVSVSEGRVALRVAGHTETLLGAGQAWSSATMSAAEPAAEGRAKTEAPATATTTSAGNSGAARDAAPASSQARASRRALALRSERVTTELGATPAAPSSNSGTSGGARSGSASSNAANDFADAMAVFTQGDFGTAERLFHTFDERYPNNAHSEDVLFLRALCRSRRGDAAGARALAQDYLRRYPRGFRAVEARRMASE